jgi:hypothetical protein
MTKHNEIVKFIFLIFFAILLFFYAAWGITHWKSTKPEPRYKNTLQRDIN